MAPAQKPSAFRHAADSCRGLQQECRVLQTVLLGWAIQEMITSHSTGLLRGNISAAALGYARRSCPKPSLLGSSRDLCVRSPLFLQHLEQQILEGLCTDRAAIAGHAPGPAAHTTRSNQAGVPADQAGVPADRAGSAWAPDCHVLHLCLAGSHAQLADKLVVQRSAFRACRLILWVLRVLLHGLLQLQLRV